MARSYTHIKQYYEEMEQMHQEGHSCREIGEKFGFTKEQVKECLRRPRRKAQKEQERVPKRRGRQAKQIPTTLSALEKEVKQLRMENELLRDFLKAVERKWEPKSNIWSYKDMQPSIRLFLCAVSLMYHAADITAFESEASSWIRNLFWWDRFRHVIIVGSICARMAVVGSSFGSSVNTASITITRRFGVLCTNMVCCRRSAARDLFIAARKHGPMRICWIVIFMLTDPIKNG